MTEIQLTFAEEEFGTLRDGVLALEESGEIDSEAVTLTAVQQQSGGPDQMFVVEALLIGGGVLAVAKLLYRWWKEAQPGMVIDQRPGATKSVYRDTAVPGHCIVTFGPDGTAATVTLQDEAVDATERIIGKVLDVLAKPVEAIGKTLAESLQAALQGEPAAVADGETGTDADKAGGAAAADA